MANPRKGGSSSAASDAGKDNKNRSGQGHTATKSGGKGDLRWGEKSGGNPGNKKLPR